MHYNTIFLAIFAFLAAQAGIVSAQSPSECIQKGQHCINDPGSTPCCNNKTTNCIVYAYVSVGSILMLLYHCQIAALITYVGTFSL